MGQDEGTGQGFPTAEGLTRGREVTSMGERSAGHVKAHAWGTWHVRGRGRGRCVPGQGPVSAFPVHWPSIQPSLRRQHFSVRRRSEQQGVSRNHHGRLPGKLHKETT